MIQIITNPAGGLFPQGVALLERIMKIQEKVKQHTIYKNKEGKRLPGVTTINGILNKPNLLAWANRIGLEGIKMDAYKDDLAGVGTLAHKMVQSKYTGEVVNFDEYSANDIKRAEYCIKSYDSWAKDKVIKPIFNENIMVSEVYQYGGTPDMLAEVNGEITLLDFKTGSGIYDEHLIQVAGGYGLLLDEMGYTPTKVTILNIPRTNSETFDTRTITELEKYKEIFRLCLKIYKLRKKENK